MGTLTRKSKHMIAMGRELNPETACTNLDKSTRNVRLGLLGISVTKPPLIEYDFKSNQWRVWTSYNTTVNLGTYIELQSNGIMQRVTINPDDSLNITTL